MLININKKLLIREALRNTIPRIQDNDGVKGANEFSLGELSKKYLINTSIHEIRTYKF